MNQLETRQAVQAGVTDSVGAFIKGAFIMVCVFSFFKAPGPWLPWLAVFGVIYGVFALADSKNKVTSWIGGALLSIIGFVFLLAILAAAIAAVYFVVAVLSGK